MDNLYNNANIFRSAYSENKVLHDVAKTHGQGVRESIIQQEVKSKKNWTK